MNVAARLNWPKFCQFIARCSFVCVLVLVLDRPFAQRQRTTHGVIPDASHVSRRKNRIEDEYEYERKTNKHLAINCQDFGELSRAATIMQSLRDTEWRTSCCYELRVLFLKTVNSVQGLVAGQVVSNPAFRSAKSE